MLEILANLNPHPESVPINILSQFQRVSLFNQPGVTIWETIRMIATAHMLMPNSDICLSARRLIFSQIKQVFCFMAGANSIFFSNDSKILTATTPCPIYDIDQELLGLLGLEMHPLFLRRQVDNERLAI